MSRNEIVAVGTLDERLFKVIRREKGRFELHRGATVIENVPTEEAISWVILQFTQAMEKS